MAEETGIEWTDSTFNPWWGCTKISPACDHCYAADLDKRTGGNHWGNVPRRRTSEKNWNEPRRWQKKAAEFFAENARKRRVFCASMADVFDNQVPPEWRDDLWALIRECPDLDWLLLTKRPQNIGKMLPAFWDEVKGHVWLGATVEDQKRAINLWHLGCVAQEHGCATTFASFEPLIEAVDPTRVVIHSGQATFYADPSITHADIIFNALLGAPSLSIPPLGWVIAGGESGPHARPSHPDWFRSLRDQCAAAGVPFLFKQWGNWDESMRHVRNKKDAGRALDGVTHDGYPVPA